ncbi:MAG: 50S ribosomal protein L40e [Candidatus Aenigmarchaeota archaeon]|nr:50S ribosomal protein L40e [Candidatus Aenigmarchaeota archaeon]
MVKKIFPEAMNRLFSRVFVCRKCKSKIRTDYSRVRDGKVKCRKCGSKQLRPKRKEKKA